MTTQQLHDALTLLPADLVAAADKRRSGKKSVLRWQQWAAMAACLALILWAGSFSLEYFGAKQAVTESAADMEMVMAAPAAPADAPADMAPAEAAEPEEQGMGGSDTGATSAKATGSSLSAPPVLEAGPVRLTAYSFQWEVAQTDGTCTATTVDAAHPTEHPDSLPVLDGSQSTLALSWERMPDTVTAQCWTLLGPDSAVNGGSREVEITEQGLALCSGTCIYEITAHWPEGIARYAFTVTAP